MRVHGTARLRLAADLLELARHLDVVEPLTGIGMELLQPAAHDGAGEIVGHQAADDAGLDGVLAHPGQARLGGPEVRRQHVAGNDAVLHHLDVAHVGSEDGEDLGPVDPGQEEHRVRYLLQHGEELGGEHVALRCRERDHHPVRVAERLPVLEEGLHVLVLEGHQLEEAGIHP